MQTAMDFIERWFHLSPDNGSGTTEAMCVMALCASLLVLIGRLRFAAVRKRCMGRFPSAMGTMEVQEHDVAKWKETARSRPLSPFARLKPLPERRMIREGAGEAGPALKDYGSPVRLHVRLITGKEGESVEHWEATGRIEEREGEESAAKESGCGCGDASANVDADRAGSARPVRGALHRQAAGGREFRGGKSNHQISDCSRRELRGTMLRKERRRHG